MTKKISINFHKKNIKEKRNMIKNFPRMFHIYNLKMMQFKIKKKKMLSGDYYAVVYKLLSDLTSHSSIS